MQWYKIIILIFVYILGILILISPSDCTIDKIKKESNPALASLFCLIYPIIAPFMWH